MADVQLLLNLLTQEQNVPTQERTFYKAMRDHSALVFSTTTKHTHTIYLKMLTCLRY
jgi:hypothetical protein